MIKVRPSQMQKIIRTAANPKYKVLYFTIGARTMTPKLLHQQLPTFLHATSRGLKTLAIHVAPHIVNKSLHFTNELRGSSIHSSKKKKFVSINNKLIMYYINYLLTKSDILLLKKIIKKRSKMGLLTVIGDFSHTSPYKPFSEIAKPLKTLLKLPHVLTMRSAAHNYGAGKEVGRRNKQEKQTNMSINEQRKLRYDYHPKPKIIRYRSHYDGTPNSKHKPLINLTSSPVRNGFLSVSMNSPNRISLSSTNSSLRNA